jgi:hypothetical protein
MNELEPTPGPDRDRPTDLDDDGFPKPQPKPRLPGGALVAGLVLFPCMLLSAGTAAIDISEGLTAPSMVLFCLVQVALLALAWNFLRKATSWGMVLAGVVIAGGLYLLSIGVCASFSSGL